MKKAVRPKSYKRWLYLPGGAIFILLLLFVLQAFSVSNPSQIPLPGAIISGKDVVLTGNAKVKGDVYSTEGVKTSGNASFIGYPRPLTGTFPLISFDYYKEKAKQEGAYIVGDLHPTDKRPLSSLIFVEGDVKISANQVITSSIFATGKIEVSGNSDITYTRDRLTLVAGKDIKLSGRGSINGVVFSQEGKIELSGDRSVSGVLVARNGVKLSGNTKAIDAYPPVPPTLSQPPSPTNNPSVILAGTAEAYSSVEVWDGANLIGTTEADGLGLYSTTTTLSEGFHTLTSTSTDNCGNRSLPSEEREVLVDITVPTVNILSPYEGETVLRTVPISVEATDNFGLEKVEFYIDSSLKKTYLSPPYIYEWDTTLYENGPHTITAKAYDLATNQATDSITVEVANNIITPEGGTFTSSDGEVFLEFPAGAVSETIMLFYTSQSPQPVEGFSSASHFFTLEAYTLGGEKVTTLNKPATITIYTIDPAAREGIGLYRFDEATSKWFLILSSHLSDDSVAATIDRLSLFALLSDTEAPVIQDKAPSGLVYTFRPTISAKVSDTGSGIKPSTVILKLDDKAVSATYNPQTGEVTCTPTSNLSYGKHKVELSVDDLAGNTSSPTWNFTVYGTPVSGPIYQDTTWTAEESPYIVTGSVTVYIGATLTIKPGTVIKFSGREADLAVSGTLIAEGTKTEKVIFTSLLDDSYGGDTNGDGSASAPTAGDWGRIWIGTSSPNSRLTHVVIKYGGRGWGVYQGAIGISSSSLSISNSIVTDSGGYGIYSKDSNVSVSYSAVSRCTYQGIYSGLQWTSNFFSLTYSNISNNSGDGAYIEADGSFDHNTISNNGGNGIFLSGSIDNFNNNRIENNTGWAATLHGSLPSDLDTNFISGNKKNALALYGTLKSGSHTWSPSLGGAYVIARSDYGGHVSVPSDATLTIKPGTVIKFTYFPPQYYQSPTGLWVSGTLIAEGSSTEKVTFTSIKDDFYGGDTNGDGNATTPAPGDWKGIRFGGSLPGNVLNQGVIKYANTSIDISSSPSITNSTISSSSGTAIVVTSGNPNIHYNDICDSGGYHLFYTGSTPINAKQNWWGAAKGVERKIVGKVDYDPWALMPYASGVAQDRWGSNTPCGYFGEPVNTAIGNYTYSHEDLKIEGRGLPLTIARAYNSLDTLYNGPFGYAWTFNYNLSLRENSDGSILILTDDGRRDTYVKTPDGGYSSPPGVTDKLLKNVDGSFTLTKKDQTKYNFDSDGKLSSLEDKNGNKTSLTYDTAKKLIKVADPSGRTIFLTYDSQAHIIKITDPLGREYRYTYDTNGDLVTYTDPKGGITRYTYSGHRITSVTDPKGQRFVENIYDSEGRVVKQYDALGNLFTYSYDKANNRTTLIDPEGNQSVHQYDAQYRLIYETDALGATTSYTYDFRGNRDSVKDKNGNTTRSIFDASGNVTQITDALGNVTLMSYDEKNNLTSKKDPLGNIIHFGYDTSSNLTSITDPLSNMTTLSYDSYGKPISVTDALSNTTAFSYDEYGNQTEVRDASGNTTSYAYDMVGRKTSATDPKGHTTKFSYDQNNNLIGVKDATGHTATYSYDANNLLTSVTDPNGHITSYQYDAMDNLTGVMDPIGNMTRYSYDGNYNRSSMTDANGKTTNYLYDPANRLVKIDYPEGVDVFFAYDSQGNRISMTDSTGTTSYSYDALNRLVMITHPSGKTVSYAYDANGRRISMNNPAGVTSYSYDSANRLITLRDPTNQTTAFTYNPVGLRTKTVYPNGVSANYSYNANNQLALLENRKSTGEILSSFSYEYDIDGQRTKMVEADGSSTSYEYDELHRLTMEEKRDALGNILYSYSYTYDPAGNRLTKEDKDGNVLNYSYDAANRIQSAGDTTYIFDANGNMTEKTTPQGTTMYSYDLENRLSNVALPDGSANSFAYDGDGKRSRKTTPAGTTNYLYDGMSVIEETDGAGGLIASYTTDPTALIGQIISRKDSASQASYYSYDGIGSTRNLTDSSQAQVASYIYDSFGNLLSSTDTVQPYKFSTKEQDQTGLYYFGARYYDAEVGRFVTKDSLPGNLRDPQSLNLYTYSYNNPVNYIDPDGEFAWAAFVYVGKYTALGALGGAAYEAIWYWYENPDTWSWSGMGKAALSGIPSGAAAGLVAGLVGLKGGPLVSDAILAVSTAIPAWRRYPSAKQKRELELRLRIEKCRPKQVEPLLQDVYYRMV